MDEVTREFLFRNSPVGAVARSWITFCERAMDYMRGSHAAMRGLQDFAAASPDPRDDDADGKIVKAAGQVAESEVSNQFAFTNAAVLMAMWGAFEAFVEDLCKTLIFEDPGLLERARGSDKALKGKPVQDLTREEFDCAYEKVVRKVPGVPRGGLAKFDRQLTLVGLAGEYPAGVREALEEAQRDRNVWAHRGGIADAKYAGHHAVQRFEPGEEIVIQRRLLEEYVLATLIFGMVILSRYRMTVGLGAAPLPAVHKHPFVSAYRQMLWAEGTLANGG